MCVYYIAFMQSYCENNRNHSCMKMYEDNNMLLWWAYQNFKLSWLKNKILVLIMVEVLDFFNNVYLSSTWLLYIIPQNGAKVYALYYFEYSLLLEFFLTKNIFATPSLEMLACNLLKCKYSSFFFICIRVFGYNKLYCCMHIVLYKRYYKKNLVPHQIE